MKSQKIEERKKIDKDVKINSYIEGKERNKRHSDSIGNIDKAEL